MISPSEMKACLALIREGMIQTKSKHARALLMDYRRMCREVQSLQGAIRAHRMAIADKGDLTQDVWDIANRALWVEVP